VLGRGSNVLVSDQGLRGVVIVLAGEMSAIKPEGEALRAGAAACLDQVAEVAEQAGLAGAEFLAGIPGTVGGGLRTNAGAFGRSLADIVHSVRALDARGQDVLVEEGHLRHEYRRPVIDPALIAVEVTLRLASGPVQPANGIREQRWARHPKEPSAGSFFRNPEGEENREQGGTGRVPAGRLIDQCGLKGRGVRGAQVSGKHANFLVNTGRARFADVYELAQVVKANVEQTTGTLMEEEIQYLPDPDGGQCGRQRAGGRARDGRATGQRGGVE
jgi:UDP-N-acetylmuramate dehydrogenase